MTGAELALFVYIYYDPGGVGMGAVYKTPSGGPSADLQKLTSVLKDWV